MSQIKRNHISINRLLYTLASICFLFSCSLCAQMTEKLYLSGAGNDNPVNWDFYCTQGRNSGSWQTIPVPSQWELQGFGLYNYGHDQPKANEQGKYRYRFDLPRAWTNKVIYIVFEGVMTDTQVWINGKSAGPIHQGGFYRFKYDISRLINVNEANVLEVHVDKVSKNWSVEQAERKADYWVFGGIYRPVYLEAFPPEYIKLTTVAARADGSLLCDVQLKGIRQVDRLMAVISGPDLERQTVFNTSLRQAQQRVQLQCKGLKIKPWNAEHPVLYDLEVSLMKNNECAHLVSKRIGFRTFEIRPQDGLYLNGVKIKLKGINRHCFWPDAGRCLSEQVSYGDVRLIKQMNMNAVRCSHYPPDTHFLKACDELGLYVLDELAGWQKPSYDTTVGKKLVKEMVTRDANHPCILFWDNANEGGWNKELDDEFAKYDLQQRAVLHPWDLHSHIDTGHYRDYAEVRKKLGGSNIYMPTEFLHGLYDGGHGAGLEDYWQLLDESPLGAGGFLWALVDEGTVRTDMNGRIDTDGNHAPDGIIGPYRQKEASFYAVKEIWSPINVEMEHLPIDFNGRIPLKNRYHFTNLKQCWFSWKLLQFPWPWQRQSDSTVLFSRARQGPDTAPQSAGVLKIDLPSSWRRAHALILSATDHTGAEVWTWSWPIQTANSLTQNSIETGRGEPVTIVRQAHDLQVTANDTVLSFCGQEGYLKEIILRGAPISLRNGPRLITGQSQLRALNVHEHQNGAIIDVSYDGALQRVRWHVYPNGWIRCDVQYKLSGKMDIMGVHLDYPEAKMRSMRWLGRGPYRVWKNRRAGGRLDVWHNQYKDHTPGMTWDFPEFRGYYQDWQWAVFTTDEGRITMLNATEDVYLGVYRPKDGPFPKMTQLQVPQTGIALLHGIPAIGTKFKSSERLGPQSQKNQATGLYQASVYLHFETHSL
jgi:hypothetical protein